MNNTNITCGFERGVATYQIIEPCDGNDTEMLYYIGVKRDIKSLDVQRLINGVYDKTVTDSQNTTITNDLIETIGKYIGTINTSYTLTTPTVTINSGTTTATGITINIVYPSINIIGNITHTGNNTMSGDSSVGGALNVTGSASLAGASTFSSSGGSITGTMSISGDSSVGGNITGPTITKINEDIKKAQDRADAAYALAEAAAAASSSSGGNP